MSSSTSLFLATLFFLLSILNISSFFAIMFRLFSFFLIRFEISCVSFNITYFLLFFFLFFYFFFFFSFFFFFYFFYFLTIFFFLLILNKILDNYILNILFTYIKKNQLTI